LEQPRCKRNVAAASIAHESWEEGRWPRRIWVLLSPSIVRARGGCSRDMAVPRGRFVAGRGRPRRNVKARVVALPAKSAIGGKQILVIAHVGSRRGSSFFFFAGKKKRRAGGRARPSTAADLEQGFDLARSGAAPDQAKSGRGAGRFRLVPRARRSRAAA